MNTPLLDRIRSPKDLKELELQELTALSAELRSVILATVSENGGHLASNLGVVELTVALHRIFQVPEDRILWDVGHQSYVHKLLTGRQEAFDHLRQGDEVLTLEDIFLKITMGENIVMSGDEKGGNH